ncbi:MAG: hypothetical protein IKS98_13050 [Lachnospiraceae bacterium]|nr:hypothetical protein [Lachnospiraceae bacterium]
MKLEERKKGILRRMRVLYGLRNYLIKNNKSREAQERVKEQFRRNGVEVESPVVGGTGADWIRLQNDDVFLFIHDNGDEWYQLDPLCQYNAELIEEYSYEDFVSEVCEVTDSTFEHELEWYYEYCA